MKLKIIALIFIMLNSYAALNEMKANELGHFSGRVSSYSKEARIVKFRVEFDNVKYLNKLDKVEFWAQHQSQVKCDAIVLGKSSDYVLLKVPKYDSCEITAPFTAGRYYFFFSQDLLNNIAMGKDLIEILTKKRLALQAKVQRNGKIVGTYPQRIDAVNNRYEVLQKKLQKEWREELAKLEQDQTEILRNTEGLQIRLNEVNHKLEQYRVEDGNLSEDRWSLDPNHYYLK